MKLTAMAAAIPLLMTALLATGCGEDPLRPGHTACMLSMTVSPQELSLAVGDSATVTARRGGGCIQDPTAVNWEVRNAQLATYRALTESTAIVFAHAEGVTALVAHDRADASNRFAIRLTITR